MTVDWPDEPQYHDSERIVYVNPTSCPIWSCVEPGEHWHLHGEFPCCRAPLPEIT